MYMDPLGYLPASVHFVSGCRALGLWCFKELTLPEGPTYTTIMELGPQNQNRDGFLGPNSIGSVYGPSGTVGF